MLISNEIFQGSYRIPMGKKGFFSEQILGNPNVKPHLSNVSNVSMEACCINSVMTMCEYLPHIVQEISSKCVILQTEARPVLYN